MLRKFRRYLLLLLAVLAVAFFLYKFRHAITLQGFRWGMVIQSIREARLSLLILSLAAIYVCYALRALRWVRFCRWLGNAHFGNVYAATLMGFACTFLLGRAGEPIRPALIARKDSLSMPGMFGVYVLERVFDFAATAVIAIFALLSFERKRVEGAGNDLLIKVSRSAGVGLLAGLVGAIVFLGLQGIRTWGDLAVLSGYTAAHWLLVVFVYLWIAQAFRGELAALGLGGAALVLAFTLVGSAVQLPGVGGGSQLATFLVFTLIFGVEKESAAMASIVVWLITFAGCCIVGFPLLFREGWSMRDLRRMAQSGEQAGEAQLLADAQQPALPGEKRR
ncbi:MAG: lysylphosphatidylglycerol synthase transmembrane domain-containing protein [Candidatus Acidiferrales bacterium]